MKNFFQNLLKRNIPSYNLWSKGYPKLSRIAFFVQLAFIPSVVFDRMLQVAAKNESAFVNTFEFPLILLHIIFQIIIVLMVVVVICAWLLKDKNAKDKNVAVGETNSNSSLN